jgi:hypothetical protein
MYMVSHEMSAKLRRLITGSQGMKNITSTYPTVNWSSAENRENAMNVVDSVQYLYLFITSAT